MNYFLSFKAEAIAFLSKHGEGKLAEEVRGLKPNFTEDFQIVQRSSMRDDITHADYQDVVADIFGELYVGDRIYDFALKEAIFQLSTDVDLTRYLMAPLTCDPRAFAAYYAFWRAGGLYCFTNSEACFSLRA
ncbi:hypothetical protein RMR10_023840 (plasmid) [Agrobacterium rosae]|uniref:hypothetical protein n=1 Tax=Agrobacterium rosae TaxID=1972867 RepID=UPI002A0C9AF0|nr:hypothetical protein [Agrobacterium rosae]MDX8317185.1 hypothetical protein [Agrobacterium rosae]